ncbi:MAG: gamma-glutamylcyclotransferase [Magnetospiraceae bacterium]
MQSSADPFSNHPELRTSILDPEKSFFRALTVDDLAARMQEFGITDVWWYSDIEREALRADALRGRPEGDLWVFAYGSLMWDPAIKFTDVRRAHAPDYARLFILKDIFGGRGTRETPGLMAALDRGPGCDGLAFRIHQSAVDQETYILWQRELLGPCYLPKFISTDIGGEYVQALTFVADHDTELIDANITREEQIKCLATGTGILGTSMEYLRNIAHKFSILGIDDPMVTALLRDAEAYLASIHAA